MAAHMKTTMDMPDSPFRRTKTLAMKRHVPMRELITEGLLHVLEREGTDAPRRVKPVTFKGSWTTLRDAIYEDSGA
jgi:hypothetical protein